ncbi:SDR family NAD(P)-dependent oxidoreductase [Pseudahrensia aquimaris]|uniref:SDR family NAD(P)-dependent oxidoreductase n=1 Tax=Pseudahrensia aquimaris TaxID=744461 RepID=A0ABW3FCN6_9HYPH
MQLRFDEKTVLVTGAAQGIGHAIAAEFAAAGARVALADIDADRLAKVASELGATAHALDLSVRQEVVTLIADMEAPPDILVHAAGGTRGQFGQSIEQVDEESWRAIFAANTDALFWLAQACAPHMKANEFGRIVAISSGAGLRPSLTGIQAYTAAKHALVGLVKQLSWEFGPFGITVNSVAPGFVRSNPTTERQWEAMGKDGQQRLIDSIHTKRLGTAEDIAAATLFFASDQASWISGQILSVDGGRS